jgi:hypothetical protein
MEIDASGNLYMASAGKYEVPIWDTRTDQMLLDKAPPLGMYEHVNDLVLEGNSLYLSNDADWGANDHLGTGGWVGANGALSIVGTDRYWSGYHAEQVYFPQDEYFTMNLPFSYSFMGSTYNSVYVSSDGVIGFDGYYGPDTGADNIRGFVPNNENLDPSMNLFNYSSRVFTDHAVFQWSSAVNTNNADTQGVTIFELVLFDDSSARFDYLFSGPNAGAEYNSIVYGVGDGDGTAVVDMHAAYGNPFDLEQRSFIWDPVSSSVAETTFTWEGTGTLHLPLMGMPHGVALSENYIFMVLPYDNDFGNYLDFDQIQIYDRNTMLPAGTITTGTGPRAIAVEP